MEPDAAIEKVKSALDVPLFSIAGTEITAATLTAFFLIVVASFVISKLLRKGVERFLTAREVEDHGTRAVISRLLHYVIVFVGVGTALHTIGINLSALFAAGALFAVAIGFAMQNVTANFVSGVILLVERSIKPGDVIEVNGAMVRVRDMGIRATIVRTLDDEDVVIPNSVLVQGEVKNFTFRDDLYRLRVEVGVAYESDLHRVRDVLEACTRSLDWRSDQRDPVVLLTLFGSSSVDYEISVWTENPWKSRSDRSRLREAIWWAFQEAGITIAFPQLDVHFDDREGKRPDLRKVQASE